MSIILNDKNPQEKMGKTYLKHYKQYRSIRTEALIWLKITTDIGNKLKV